MSDTCRATRIQICSRISTRIAVSFGAHRLERGPFYGAQRRPRSAYNSGALLQSEWTGYPTSLFRRMTAVGGGFNRSLQHILQTSQLGSDRARSFGVFH